MIIGAHLTIAGGLSDAFRLAHSVGGSTFQFFTRNPRGGRQREMSQQEIDEARQVKEQFGIRALVGHFPYTVNLASPMENAYAFARETLRSDLRWGARMGADVLVVHPGSHVGEGVEAGLKRIVDAVAYALDGYDGETMLLLETMTGQGSEIGSEPAHHRAVFEALGWPERLGICMDSCHLFAAGFDIRSPQGVEEMLRVWDEAVGLEQVRCLHLNDSKVGLGARKDRHELLTRGHLGEAGIASVIRHPFFRALPIVIETPVEDYPDYAGEIALALRLAAG
jgi:deoxyribonuclease IV